MFVFVGNSMDFNTDLVWQQKNYIAYFATFHYYD